MHVCAGKQNDWRSTRCLLMCLCDFSLLQHMIRDGQLHLAQTSLRCIIHDNDPPHQMVASPCAMHTECLSEQLDIASGHRRNIEAAKRHPCTDESVLAVSRRLVGCHHQSSASAECANACSGPPLLHAIEPHSQPLKRHSSQSQPRTQ